MQEKDKNNILAAPLFKFKFFQKDIDHFQTTCSFTRTLTISFAGIEDVYRGYVAKGGFLIRIY
jgi:hypothetical protein